MWAKVLHSNPLDSFDLRCDLVFVTWARVVCLICTTPALGPATPSPRARGPQGAHTRQTTRAHATNTKYNTKHAAENGWRSTRATGHFSFLMSLEGYIRMVTYDVPETARHFRKR